MRLRELLGIPLFLLLLGCPQGSALHKATIAEHNFRFAVQAFADAETAEYDKGFVPGDLHLKMQGAVLRIALAGKDLDNALVAGASPSTIKTKLDAIYVLLDSLNTDGVLGIKSVATRAELEIALDAIKAIIDSALIQVQ